MKEIFEGIWNAPKEQVLGTINHLVLLWIIVSLISAVIGYIIFKRMSRKMGFGKEWDDKWKKFDEDFKRF